MTAVPLVTAVTNPSGLTVAMQNAYIVNRAGRGSCYSCILRQHMSQSRKLSGRSCSIRDVAEAADANQIRIGEVTPRVIWEHLCVPFAGIANKSAAQTG